MPAPKPPDAPFRPNLYVVARFLDALARPDVRLTRSQAQTAVGVNYDVFRRYLHFLVEKGYVAVQPAGDGSEAILLTAEGRRVRAELMAWIARFLGQSALLPGGGADPKTLKDPGPSPAPP